MKKFFENVKEKVNGFFGSIKSFANKVFGFAKDAVYTGLFFTTITLSIMAIAVYFGAVKTKDFTVSGYNYTKGLFVKAEPVTA